MWRVKGKPCALTIIVEKAQKTEIQKSPSKVAQTVAAVGLTALFYFFKKVLGSSEF